MSTVPTFALRDARRAVKARGHDVNGQPWYSHSSTWRSLECRRCLRQVMIDATGDGIGFRVWGYALNNDCDNSS